MLVFRADGNANIGSGHVMRCLSIADAARDMGEESVFITASNDMETVISSRNYKNIILNTNYKDIESENILSALNAYCSPIVFVDSYYVSAQYLEKLWSYCNMHGGKLVYIDDIKQFASPCDVLINYQVHGSKEEYDTLYAEY